MTKLKIFAMLLLLACGTVAHADQTSLTFDTIDSTFLIPGWTQYQFRT